MWDLQLKDFFRVLYVRSPRGDCVFFEINEFQWLNISAIVYGIVLFLIKLSILLQYLRIFVPTRKGNMSLFIAIHVTIWIVFLFYFAITVVEIFLCTPRKKIWNPLLPRGHCLDQNAPYLGTGIFNIISDFAILVLPIAPIWKLQMAVKKKLMIAAIFAAGLWYVVLQKIIHSRLFPHVETFWFHYERIISQSRCL